MHEPFNIPNITIDSRHEAEEHGGTITISGLKLPNIDAIAQIWAGIRKRNYADYGVDVVAIPHLSEDGVINIELLLNTGVAENSAMKIVSQQEKGQNRKLTLVEKEVIKLNEIKKDIAKFDETFYLWVSKLDEVLDAFVCDFENGYTPYLTAVEEGTDGKKVEKMIDRFLSSVGIRNKK